MFQEMLTRVSKASENNDKSVFFHLIVFQINKFQFEPYANNYKLNEPIT